MPVISDLERLRQGHCLKFEVSFGYIVSTDGVNLDCRVSSKPAWAGLHLKKN